MFIPLEDYVEKYCPNIKAAWEAEPTMRQMVTNRTVISILCPVRSLCVRRAAIRPLSTRHGWIVWVWKCPPPWTSGTEVLKAFKEQDANGNDLIRTTRFL